MLVNILVTSIICHSASTSIFVVNYGEMLELLDRGTFREGYREVGDKTCILCIIVLL